MKEMTIDLHNYPEDAEPFLRVAVRGIVRRGDKYLMIYSSKYGDCKFPGGGQDPGETNEETLIREVREEAGYDVLPETVQEYLLVHERRLGMKGDPLFMDSYYYFCEVGEAQHPQNLQDYEIDEEYRVLWLTLSEAVAINKTVTQYELTPWVERATAVKQRLLEEQGQEDA